MSDTPTIHGDVATGFEPVADAFAQNFADLNELGAACSIVVDGATKVDIWAGVADKASGRAWERDTLQLVFSTTKSVAAICIAQQVERGKLAYDDPVAKHWPEFAANGKGDVTVEQMLSHQAGLFAVDATLSFAEIMAVTPVVDALAAQTPLDHPGTHAYHAITYGWLASELLARVDGRRIGQYVAEELAGPLGEEFYIGLPAEHEPRVSTLELAPPPSTPEAIEAQKLILGPGTNGLRALTCDGVVRMAPTNHFNTPELHATEMPGANGIGTARALAKIHAATIGEVDGVRLIDHDTMQQARTQRVQAPDGSLLVESRFGAGFWLHNVSQPMIQDGSFGHPGAGGSVSFANPELGVGFSYVMNQMGGGIVGDPRPTRICDALRDCL